MEQRSVRQRISDRVEDVEDDQRVTPPMSTPNTFTGFAASNSSFGGGQATVANAFVTGGTTINTNGNSHVAGNSSGACVKDVVKAVGTISLGPSDDAAVHNGSIGTSITLMHNTSADTATDGTDSGSRETSTVAQTDDSDGKVSHQPAATKELSDSAINEMVAAAGPVFLYRLATNKKGALKLMKEECGAIFKLHTTNNSLMGKLVRRRGFWAHQEVILTNNRGTYGTGKFLFRYSSGCTRLTLSIPPPPKLDKYLRTIVRIINGFPDLNSLKLQIESSDPEDADLDLQESLLDAIGTAMQRDRYTSLLWYDITFEDCKIQDGRAILEGLCYANCGPAAPALPPAGHGQWVGVTQDDDDWTTSDEDEDEEDEDDPDSDEGGPEGDP